MVTGKCAPCLSYLQLVSWSGGVLFARDRDRDRLCSVKLDGETQKRLNSSLFYRGHQDHFCVQNLLKSTQL
jgi:hypothetical protein